MSTVGEVIKELTKPGKERSMTKEEAVRILESMRVGNKVPCSPRQMIGYERQNKAIDIAVAELLTREPERKKGKWMLHEDEDGEHYGDKCSECCEWYVMPYGKTNFCPNCGADMRGGADERFDQ